MELATSINKLDYYIMHLPLVNIDFVYMNVDRTMMKTFAHALTKNITHYVTKSYAGDYFVYIYKSSTLKYIILASVKNTYPIVVHKLRITSASASEMESPYAANHGNHLSFGIQKSNINTHKTLYELNEGSKTTCDIFHRVPSNESCSFKFDPIMNTKYNLFKNIQCSRTSTNIEKTFEEKEDKLIIHHLLKVMSGLTVPVLDLDLTIQTGQGFPSSISYKNINFMSDEFHEFIRISLLENPEHGHNFLLTMFFHADYKNIVVFLDLDADLGGYRVILFIYAPTALKACYASSASSKSNDEMNSLKMFQEHVEKVYKNINAALFYTRKKQ